MTHTEYSKATQTIYNIANSAVLLPGSCFFFFRDKEKGLEQKHLPYGNLICQTLHFIAVILHSGAFPSVYNQVVVNISTSPSHNNRLYSYHLMDT